MNTQGYETQAAGDWTELKGKVNEGWGELSGDEVREFQGNVQQLVGYIQQKTGETQQLIEQKLVALDARFRPMLEQASATAQEYLQSGSDAANDAAAYVRDAVAAKHAQAEQAVRRKPIESVAVAFGTGIIAGAVIGLILKQR
ncbi:hypothetical protein Pla123a_39010 [Posidoniimonas polymericola]|uniref:CsbD-like domain-containing protein n=1 Tax=Posidoniimonas polymericola TaxID=2528002 RepID=A0A5C5YGN0_9BACT|nr:CsbD family protein [Posidoniimonas polymericola]TWT73565.1 hypothetical protein Pla123a_39010 [Posidoniimonas polymericola]